MVHAPVPPPTAAAVVPCGEEMIELKRSSVDVIDGIRQKRLGGSGIIVSEIGLGTQRWGSTDFNAPDMAACHALMDRAILESGVNLVDTAEQYPIPSDDLTGRPEGYLGLGLG